MSELNSRAVTALTTLRNAVRDVARSLLDDGPHTYVSSVSSALTRAIDRRGLATQPYDRALTIGELDGVSMVLQVMTRDPWSKFTEDAVRCARKLLAEINPDAVAKEERCVATLVEEAKKLCNPPDTRILTNAWGVFILVREEHGRTLAIFKDGADSSGPMMRTRGALADDQINERIRCYVAGETAGVRQGSEEIRTGLRLLLNVAAADHRHGDA